MTHGQAYEFRMLDDEALAARRKAAYEQLEADADAGAFYDWPLATEAAILWEETERRASLSNHQRMIEHALRLEAEGVS